MSLPNRTKKVIWVLIAFLIILGLLIMVLELGHMPEWIEFWVWVFIILIAWGGLSVVYVLVDDLVGHRIDKASLKRYMVIFLPPAIVSFLITGFSAALEDKHFSWSPFPGYFILCLIFWYLGAAFHTFIFEQKIARCPKCELEAFCPRCDKEYFDEMTWGEYLDKKKDK